MLKVMILLFILLAGIFLFTLLGYLFGKIRGQFAVLNLLILILFAMLSYLYIEVTV